MESTTITAARERDIFDDDRELQLFPNLGLTPGSKLEPPFLWEFPAFLGRASPLPAARAILKKITNKQKS
ncbi:MAG: hypothetical protein LBB26_01475 [Puniceicoccales bacterium]|jgi:hypothetical protein|nr:hypothetical protein [Puniceicoccales bacterium]